MLIELWQTKKRIAFLHGAITLSICLFMKGLLTFSMDGLTILKTWACCSEREDSSWFLLDLASLTFCFLKHLRYCRFWKTGKNPPVDVFCFCFVMSQNVTTRLYPSVYSQVFHWVHLRLQAPLINRGMVPICCFPFAYWCFFLNCFGIFNRTWVQDRLAEVLGWMKRSGVEQMPRLTVSSKIMGLIIAPWFERK